MRVSVIGAGLAGVATAHELVLRGHEVQVFDRRPAVASESSFAPAGLLAPGLLALGLTPSPGFVSGIASAQAAWLWQRWRAGRDPRRAARDTSLQALARLGRGRVQDIATRLRMDVEQASGVTVLCRHERQTRALRTTLTRLAEAAPPHQWLDPASLRAQVPALNPKAPLHAALQLTQDGTGNARHYAQLLKDEAQRRGAVFHLSQSVQALRTGSTAGAPVLLELAGTPGEARSALEFDAVVVCTGAAANALLQPLACPLPFARAHVHALTAMLSTHDSQWPDSPQGALFDLDTGSVMSRLGPRLRVTGAATMGGAAAVVQDRALRLLYGVLEHWLPGVAQMRSAQHWKGARALVPDGAPVLGAVRGPRVTGVWLNLGHDLHGWPLACGAAVVLAAQIDGDAAPGQPDLGPLGAARWL